MASDNINLRHVFFPADPEAPGVSWQPAADVYRTADGWLVKIDLAGVKPEEVSIQAGRRELQVAGVRRDWSVDEGCCHYQLEIAYSTFERRIRLPENIDQQSVTVEYRCGLLLVRLRREASPNG